MTSQGTPDQVLLLTTAEVAVKFRVRQEVVRRWASEGRLEAQTLPSGRLRFSATAVDALRARPGDPQPADVTAGSVVAS